MGARLRAAARSTRRWAATGEQSAPKYHRVDGLGKVDEVRDRLFAALG